MLNDKVRPLIQPFTAGVGRGMARIGLTPNVVTLTGLAWTFVCVWLVVIGHRTMAGIVMIPAWFLDIFDGALARVTNRVTPWGGFLDSVCDRIGDGALLAAICLLAQHFIFFSHAGTSTWQKLFGLTLTIVVGGATFFGAAYLLHVAELRDVVLLVRGRLSRLR